LQYGRPGAGPAGALGPPAFLLDMQAGAVRQAGLGLEAGGRRLRDGLGPARPGHRAGGGRGRGGRRGPSGRLFSHILPVLRLSIRNAPSWAEGGQLYYGLPGAAGPVEMTWASRAFAVGFRAGRPGSWRPACAGLAGAGGRAGQRGKGLTGLAGCRAEKAGAGAFTGSRLECRVFGPAAAGGWFSGLDAGISS
jgi:hypothetical protein